MIDLAQLLYDHANATGVKFRNNYSGRAMYGKDCVGLVGELREIQTLVAELTVELIEQLYDYAIDANGDGDSEDDDIAETYHDNVIQAIEMLSNWRIDNMGLQMIMYWPDIVSTHDFDRMEGDQ
jgi:NADPH-dependent glutamate synthase beta subunit-like oxidoreductase